MKIKKLSFGFVTSLVITVLLVVALSTATFAWFTSSSTVNITDFMFVAQKGSNEASGNLLLSWHNNEDWVTTLSFGASDGKQNAYDLYEGIPISKPYIGMPYSEFIAFNSANTYSVAQKDGTVKHYYYKDGVRYEPKACYKKDEPDKNQSEFYIKNDSKHGVSVNVSCQFEDEISPAIKLAIFVDGNLAGILCKSDDETNNVEQKVYYGEIKKDADAAKSLFTPFSREVIFDMKPSVENTPSVRELKFVPWLCGVTVDDSYRNKFGKAVNIVFDGEYISQ